MPHVYPSSAKRDVHKNTTILSLCNAQNFGLQSSSFRLLPPRHKSSVFSCLLFMSDACFWRLILAVGESTDFRVITRVFFIYFVYIAWAGLIWFRIQTSGRLMCTLWYTVGFRNFWARWRTVCCSRRTPLREVVFIVCGAVSRSHYAA